MKKKKLRFHRLTESDIINVISEYKKGSKILSLSKKYPVSGFTINGIICYYNERSNLVSETLSPYYKEKIDKIKGKKIEINKDDSMVVEYEAKILFGLITIKIKPVKN